MIISLTPSMDSSRTGLGELIIFQPILQAYPTQHSWIITAHISLGNLEHNWKTFNRQYHKTQQLLQSFEQHPSAPTELMTALQLEFSNIEEIYKSAKSTITSAVKLLQSNQLQPSSCCKRSLLLFLGDALSWLTRTATTKDIQNMD